MTQLNAVQTLLGLLSHDNSDIALAVVDLLQELTDVESVNEAEQEVEGLVDSLLREQVGGCVLIVTAFIHSVEVYHCTYIIVLHLVTNNSPYSKCQTYHILISSSVTHTPSLSPPSPTDSGPTSASTGEAG